MKEGKGSASSRVNLACHGAASQFHGVGAVVRVLVGDPDWFLAGFRVQERRNSRRRFRSLQYWQKLKSNDIPRPIASAINAAPSVVWMLFRLRIPLTMCYDRAKTPIAMTAHWQLRFLWKRL